MKKHIRCVETFYECVFAIHHFHTMDKPAFLFL